MNSLSLIANILSLGLFLASSPFSPRGTIIFWCCFLLMSPGCVRAHTAAKPPNSRVWFVVWLGWCMLSVCVDECLRVRRSRWVVHMLRSEAPLRPKKLLGSVNTHCGESKHSQHAISAHRGVLGDSSNWADCEGEVCVFVCVYLRLQTCVDVKSTAVIRGVRGDGYGKYGFL